MWELFWDVETKSWFDEVGGNDPAKLGVSIVSVFWRHGDKSELISFWENDFDSMWKLFRQADRVIGFNTKGFDVLAMSPYAPTDFDKLPHFDIYEQLKLVNDGRGASLNALAKASLNTAKIDSGANAITYWRKGDPQSLALLKKYCEADVIITRDIYDFALRHNLLRFVDKWNNLREVKVNFAYPTGTTAAKQSSLF
ncbi:MAG: ribonuclease H-like domain-containing protein [bacterium]|nr:ribonuclease H-like domain-containing protein [bacterium]